MAWYKTSYTSWTPWKDSQYFGCQRAHQPERALHGAFMFQQFPAKLEHTGPSLITSSHLPSSPGAPPSTSSLLSTPRGCHGTPHPGPVGSSSQTGVNIPAALGIPTAALDKLLKIWGLFKEKLQLLERKKNGFAPFLPFYFSSLISHKSSISFFITNTCNREDLKLSVSHGFTCFQCLIP